MSKSDLDFLSSKTLLEYAGSRSYQRGEEYFQGEYVFGLAEYQGKIVAKVSGTHDYQVKLWADDEGYLEYDCTCPFAAEGNFCKHCVAVGLAWLAEKEGGQKQKPRSEKSKTNLDDVKEYLLTREKPELVEMLMQEVLANEKLRGSLFLAIAKSNPRGVDVETYRQEIKRVFNVEDYDYDDYYGGSFDTDEMEQVVSSIADLLEDGHAETVIDLCEYALKRGSKAMNMIHDEGEVYGVLEELQEIHYEACEKAKPDGEKLAQRLFDWELNEDGDVFYRAVDRYADIIGKKGLKVYRQLIEKEFEKLPALKPGDGGSHQRNRYQITNMMESLASAEGDIEKLVEVKSRDLSNPYKYLGIAEIYRANKKYDKALEWAERGVSDFPNAEGLDWRLGEFLANEYHRRKRHDEAMDIIWKQFEKDVGLGNYNKLKENADKVKPESTWDDWREKALKFIRKDIAERKKNKSSGWHYRRADNSLLVTIFFQENLPEKAWEEANKGGCSEDLWLKLANNREKEHPADALKIYQDRIEPKIQETNNQAYEQAVRWIQKVKELMERLGKADEFESYLVVLRVNYKIKRNFIKLLNSMNW